MKKIISILSLLIIPFVALGDVLPEPFENSESSEININNDEEYIITNDYTDGYDNISQDSVEYTETEESIETKDSIETDESTKLQDINPEDRGLSLITFGFCNEGTENLSKNLNYAVNVGQPLKVCSLFYNGANEDINIKIRIVDQGITAQGDRYCVYESTNIQNFMTKSDLEDLESVVIPAGEYVIKEFELTFPVGVEGNQSACLTYYIPKTETSNTATIASINNKYSFMDFFVGGLENIKNEIAINDMKIYLDNNKDLKLDFTLSNIGNLEDEIVIQGEITNIFGFKKDFNIEGKGIQLAPGRSAPVSAILGSLPNYGGLFNIKFTVTSSPFFSYDISTSSIDPTLLEDKVFTVSTTYFQMPWLIFVLVVMFILILILLFRKPKNKQQNGVPYTPVTPAPANPVSN